MGSKLDQDLAGMRDSLPRIWYALYQGGLDAGFNERRSFSLVVAFILAQCPNGIRPPEAVDESSADDDGNKGGD